MGKEKEKSIIEDALTDYKKIQEAAEVNAAKRLANEFPEKFKNFLNEEINKDNSGKEPYKKVEENKESKNIDESENKNNKSVMKKEKKETKKQVIKEEREKDFTGDVENDTPNLGKGETEDGDTFVEKSKSESGESLANKTSIKEEFDVTDLDIDGAEAAIDSVDADDEIVSMEDIEKEISEMEQMKNDLDATEQGGGEFNLVSMKDKLQEMLDGIEQMQEMYNSEVSEQKQQGGKQNYKGRENGGPTTKMIDEKDRNYDEEQGKVPGEQDTGLDEYTNEQKQQGGKQNYKGRENGGPTTKMIDEEEDIITDDDIESIVNDYEVDEAMGMAHSSSKHVAGDHLPGKDFAKHRHKRSGSINNPKNESVNKKFNSLLEENKKLSKRINESKKYKKTVDQLLESYKTALNKYRSQLKDMAVFNTNLAHVNNLLVNESLALTQEDKVKIINDFKSVNTISESKNKYDSILSEMKESKKTINENIENKVSASVGESSKKQVNEVIEKTAYENNEHINKIKNLIEYVEGRGKKIIK